MSSETFTEADLKKLTKDELIKRLMKFQEALASSSSASSSSSSSSSSAAVKVEAAEEAEAAAAPAAAAAATTTPALDPESLTAAELKSELSARGLPTSGVKKLLVLRLTEALEAEAQAQAPTPAPAPAATSSSSSSSAAAATTTTTSAAGGRKRKAPEPEPEPEPAAEEEPAPAAAAPAKGRRGAAAAAPAAAAAAAPAAPAAKAAKKRKVDECCLIAGASVVDDWDCVLNQTNVGANNNKFYKIQLIKDSANQFSVFTHWGRVGEVGQSQTQSFGKDQAAAQKEFEKKFKDKTKNAWSDRANFVSHAGKYTLLEIEVVDDEEVAALEEKVRAALYDKKSASSADAAAAAAELAALETKPCQLVNELESFIRLIFDDNMFKSSMRDLQIDLTKLPLGKLSKNQLEKGFAALEEIEQLLEGGSSNRAKLNQLSSTFYTLIPHDFGRSVPPCIDSKEVLTKKMDMLNVLTDIEFAQDLQQKKKKEQEEKLKKLKAEQERKELPVHPLDLKYDSLHCDLATLDTKSKEYTIIHKYFTNTKHASSHARILQVFTVDRHDEEKRFNLHSDIIERKLLWHGTSPAVVAAILSSGLRIMPHSGGRVGKGIYLASQHEKSAGYTGRTSYLQYKNSVGIMFLVEAALGESHSITRDNSSLKAPPKGYDSIIAQGQVEPDPKDDTTISFADSKKQHHIVVPQGKPISRPEYAQSSFHHSEYLLYQESQHRIRYVLLIDFGAGWC